MSRREPPDVAILAARMIRAYPALSPYSAASLAVELCAIERAQRRHAERYCSGPRATPGEIHGYCKLVPLPAGISQDPRAPRGMKWTDDPDAKQRTGERIARRLFRWRSRIGGLLNPCNPGETCVRTDLEIRREYDPRGAVLLLRLPGEAEPVAV